MPTAAPAAEALRVEGMTQLGAWRRLVSSVFRATPVAWRGKCRVAEWLLRIRGEASATLVHTRWGELGLPSLSESIGFFLLVDGVYEPDSVRFLERHLKPGGCFVDIGANVGFLTLVGARRVGKQGRVLAVEASERIHSYLQDNVVRNALSQVALHRCAVHEEDGAFRDFYDAPIDRFGKGSLAPQYYQTPIVVPTRTLDSLVAEASLPVVDVLKVDVEGFEAGVFRGATRLLEATTAPYVLFEFEDWSETRAGFPGGCAQEVLLDKGYRLARLGAWLENGSLLERPLRSGAAMLVGVPPERGWKPTSPHV